MHAPLHVYFRLYIDQTLLHISVIKQQNATFNSPCYCHICASNKCTPLMPHAQITQCASMGEVFQYIYATYELIGINLVKKRAVHKRQ